MQDLKLAIRLMARNWGLSLAVIAILGLCIGANTAVLSIVNAAIMRPLPYLSPGRLFNVVTIFPHDTDAFQTSVDGFTWELVRDRVPVLDVAVYGGSFGGGVNMGVNGNGILVQQGRVSEGFFRVLGSAQLIGREFSPDEDRAGGPAAVILSHGLWIKDFGRDPNIIGRSILLRGEPHLVVGVMPKDFRWQPDTGLWTPLRPSRTGEGSGSNYGMIARLRPGASREQAEAQLALLTEEVRREGSYGRNSGVRIGIVPLQEGITQDLRQPLKILWTAVVAVFILGCVNVAGMLLARSTGRAGEMATRLALGASPGRIVRQLLLESTVIGLIGGAAGVLVGWAALDALRSLSRNTFPFLKTVDMDWRVLLVTLGLTLAVGLACGLVPAWQASRVDLRDAQGGSRSVAGRRRFVSLGLMLAGQVALAVPLLVAAGLLLHTFVYLWNLNPGFDQNHVLTARFSLQDSRYVTSAQVNQLYEKVIARLHETPGIEAGAASLTLPYERALNQGVRLPGRADYQTTNLVYVTSEYFRALRTSVFQGREFTAADGPHGARVAIVNQAFANTYLKDALGQLIRFGSTPIEIVGVVGNVQEKRAGWGNYGPIAQVPTVFVPAAQMGDSALRLVHTWFSPSWIVRSPLVERDVATAISDAVRSVDPLLPVAEFRSIRDLKAQSLEQQRLMAVLVDAFGVLAILLVALGIYGLAANLAADKTRELGIRLALGSTAPQAVWTALNPALTWVLGGVIAGTAVAVATEQFLRSFLWGVQSSDPVTLGAVAFGILAATALASLLPAARIARLNPADTLRAE